MSNAQKESANQNTHKKKAKKKNNDKDKWVIALLMSIAVNGVLAGLLISKGLHPNMGEPDSAHVQSPLHAMPADPRRIVRTLPQARRKQVMMSAMKKLKLQKSEHPRQIFKQLRKARIEMMRLLRADEIDTVAIEQSLSEIRILNQKLAVSGDALMLEVLAQLTPEERKTALAAMRDKRPKDRKYKTRKNRRKTP